MCLTSCWLTAAAVGSWKTDPVTIRCQQTNPSRWLLPFLAALIAALAAILLGTTASTSATVRAEDRVGAFKVAGEVLVEPPQHESPGQRLGEAAAGPEFVVATGVAAETAGTATGRVSQTVSQASEWLGPEARSITNGAGDKIFLSRDGLRRIRVDIKQPYPHSSPHAHVEQLIDGSWVKSGPIYPSDVPAG